MLDVINTTSFTYQTYTALTDLNIIQYQYSNSTGWAQESIFAAVRLVHILLMLKSSCMEPILYGTNHKDSFNAWCVFQP